MTSGWYAHRAVDYSSKGGPALRRVGRSVVTRFKIDAVEILVDDMDAHVVMARNWYIDDGGYANSGHGNRLHRILTNAVRGEIVDHKNRNKNDYRRENLRITNRSGNSINSKMRAHNKSGFRECTFAS
jgi:hypothetical protein